MSARCLALLSLALPQPPAPAAWIAGAPPGTPTALLDRGGDLLLGTDRGLYRWGAGGWSLVLTRGGVRDLAGGPSGVLVATAHGLYLWAADAPQPHPVPLGAGARVRSVAAAASGGEWVGTEVGLFRRPAGSDPFRRDASLPAGDVAAVRGLAEEVWVATRRRLWRSSGDGPFALELRGLDDGWWELCGAASGPSALLLCVPAGLWQVGAGGAERVKLGVGPLRGLARVGGRLWVASERGLFELVSEAPGRLEAHRVLAGDARALAAADGGLLVATSSGVARVAVPAAGARAVPLVAEPAGTPSIERVRRAVLAYLELSPARTAALEARARRAALWPLLSASLAVERGRGRDRERDQTFSTGAVRDLVDRASDHDRGVELRLELEWELSELRDPGRAIAVSRERRELIELRDQVLERVNRLYFERLRVLARLAALGPDSAEERAALELQARELAAGLDAWSGGTFSRLTAASPQSPRRSEP